MLEWRLQLLKKLVPLPYEVTLSFLMQVFVNDAKLKHLQVTQIQFP
jgi:hypothetical protein